jgi:hypothetical protein
MAGSALTGRIVAWGTWWKNLWDEYRESVWAAELAVCCLRSDPLVSTILPDHAEQLWVQHQHTMDVFEFSFRAAIVLLAIALVATGN